MFCSQELPPYRWGTLLFKHTPAELRPPHLQEEVANCTGLESRLVLLVKHDLDHSHETKVHAGESLIVGSYRLWINHPSLHFQRYNQNQFAVLSSERAQKGSTGFSKFSSHER